MCGLFEQKNNFPVVRLRPKHFLENIELYFDCKVNNIQLFADKKTTLNDSKL